MANIIEGFVPYQGEHCETTAMGNLLQFMGVRHEFPESFLYARADRRPAAARSRYTRSLDQECARLFEPAHSQYRQ